MTNPEQRCDPWKEALECYNFYFDQVVTVGKYRPDEFKFDLIGKYFQKGFNETKGDWIFRMDIDYFFHEKDLDRLRKSVKKRRSVSSDIFSTVSVFYT